MIERLLAAERELAEGRLEPAEQLFRQVAEADERNAIAVAGLAQVALARGEPEAAAALAERALAIDPDDAAAERLLARAREATGAVAPAAALSTLGRLRAWLRRMLGQGG